MQGYFNFPRPNRFADVRYQLLFKWWAILLHHLCGPENDVWITQELMA